PAGGGLCHCPAPHVESFPGPSGSGAANARHIQPAAFSRVCLVLLGDERPEEPSLRSSVSPAFVFPPKTAVAERVICDKARIRADAAVSAASKAAASRSTGRGRRTETSSASCGTATRLLWSRP